MQRRDAVARRLGEANVSRNHRAIELVAEMLLQIRGHVEGQRIARIVHCAQQALDLELWIQMRAHPSDRLHQIG